MLAAPTAPDERLPRVCARSRGFVYAVGLLGVTGERAEPGGERGGAGRSGSRRSPTCPVLVGVGVSNAAQAVEAVRVADGVIQGASVVRRLMDDGVEAVAGYIAEVRAAIDAATPDRWAGSRRQDVAKSPIARVGAGLTGDGGGGSGQNRWRAERTWLVEPS